MREIKFRAWLPKENRWWKGIFKNEYGSFSLENVGNFQDWGNYQFSDFTISQFAGLKNKNGKEIWEGDIIKAPYQKTFDAREIRRAWLVEWDLKFGGAFVKTRKGTSVPLESGVHDTEEVIGNIYESFWLLSLPVLLCIS